MTNKRTGGILNNWYKKAISKRPMSCRVPTEDDEYDFIIIGNISEDTYWDDYYKNHGNKWNQHKPLYTSEVVSLKEDTVETLNTIYKLGNRHEDFDKLWEDSKQALVPYVDLEIPHYQINEELLCSVPVCYQSKHTRQENKTVEETPWSGMISNIDHPSFTKLRDVLGSQGMIEVQRSWCNGDSVLKEFYLNDKLFKVGEQFPCAAAMRIHLGYKE